MTNKELTNKELREKYPIGTKIKWTLSKHLANDMAEKDIGKIGTIVGYDKHNCPFIYLFGSKHLTSNSTQDIPISWWSSWQDIEILVSKNQQLLFSFME